MKRLSVLSALLLLAGCVTTTSAPVCTSPSDNPEHHFVQAMEHLAAQKIQDADRAVSRALECDERYAPAYAAQALLYVLRATDSTQKAEDRQVNVERALKTLVQTERLSKTDEHKFIYHLSAIRVLGRLQGRNWQSQVEKHLKSVSTLKVNNSQLLYYRQSEAADYFAGLVCFRDARDFDCTRSHMRQVLDADHEGPWHAQADLYWKRADQAIRATSGLTLGRVAQKIVGQGTISRADAAAFLIDELRIDKLFAGRIPIQSEDEARTADFIPADITQHPFRQEILTLLKWQVRGLEPRYDATTRAYLFFPDRPLNRKEFAFILEDLLIRLTGDKGLSRKFVGEKSPYPDIASHTAWFNAVMVAVTRGLMETTLSGEFHPEDALSGTEFLLSTRKLRHELDI